MGSSSYPTTTPMMPSESDLERFGLRFRRALERYLRDNPEVNLSTNWVNPTRGSFPLDCCKATSWMLGLVLSKTLGLAGLQYVCGERGSESHGWLQCGDLLIDLTADQFDDQNREVIVTQVNDSTWHDSFRPHHHHPCSLRSGHVLIRRAEEVLALMGSLR